MTKAILSGKTDAENSHVQFDEREGASAKPRRGFQPCNSVCRPIVSAASKVTRIFGDSLRLAKASSYYPERDRKSSLRRYFELLCSCGNPFYNAYGMDIAGSSKQGYCLEQRFWRRVISLNCRTWYRSVLRDKLLFGLFMREHKIPTPEIVAHVRSGEFYLGREILQFEEWYRALPEGPLFVKDNDSCARGVRKINKNMHHLIAGDFPVDCIVQRAITNCEAINRIQPNSVNTLRIVTLMSEKDKEPVLLSPGGLRIGSGDVVDNWAAGGVFVGIDDTGHLGKYGYFKPSKHNPQKTDRHPVTGFVFEGKEIPFYDEAVRLVVRAHRLLPEVSSIGWDVALTPNGPFLIEGNDDWEISLMQIVAGGLEPKIVNVLGLR